MAEVTGSLRARKKAATEAALQQSALSLFASKGYDSTTIEEIVADADVSRRTFFRYFSSKEEVIFKDADADIEAFRRFVRARPQDETELQALKESLVEFVEYLHARGAPVLKFVDVVLASGTLRGRSAELQGRWTMGASEELANRAEVDLGMKHRLLGAIGIAALSAGIQAWSFGLTADIGQAVREAFLVIEDGSLFE